MAGFRLTKWQGSVSIPLVLALLAYLVLWLVLVPHYMSFYYKDEISYVAAAERYARGEWSTAPNSLWGPLISWLVAVALRLGMTSIVASRVVSLILGGLTLWSVQRLARTFALSRGLQALYLAILVPYLTYYALFGVCDDLALTGLLTYYFATIFDPRYSGRRFAGALCGVLGGVAYYAKGFALGFFLIHFTICSAIHFVAAHQSEARRNIVNQWGAGLAVFAVLAALWVGLLNQKYGIVTFGITGKYNYEIMGPEAKDRPTFAMGFVRPPEATTVSIWEDPAYLYDVPKARECCLKPWSPFDSRIAFQRQIDLFKLNLGRTLLVFLKYSPLTYAVALGGLVFGLLPLWAGRRADGPRAKPKSWRARRNWWIEQTRDLLGTPKRFVAILALFTILLYPIPYTLVFSDERFFWPVLIVILGLGLSLLDHLVSTASVPPKIRPIMLGVFALSFLPFPLHKLTESHAARDATASFARQLEAAHMSGITFASNTDYGAAVCVGYQLKAKYFGQAAPDMSDREIANDLQHQGVQYYFVWDAPAVSRPGMTLIRVLKAEYRTLAIYAVQSQAPTRSHL